jgi:HPt (histidine-containing phosphotransfer) domain-containing protein
MRETEPTIEGSADPEAEFARLYAELRRQFGTRLADDAAAIRSRAAAIRGAQTTAERQERVSELIQLVHTLAGSAGTFGYAEITAVAQEVELRLKSLPAKADVALAAALEPVEFLVRLCTEAAERPTPS